MDTFTLAALAVIGYVFWTALSGKRLKVPGCLSAPAGALGCLVWLVVGVFVISAVLQTGR